MIIEKDVERYVQKKYHFTKGKIDIDANYFIKKIQESCQSEKNLNYKTNIKGLMTPYKFFIGDRNFQKPLFELIDFVDQNFNYVNYHCEDAWGFEVRQREKTTYHNHRGSLWSGVIYLNSSTQLLRFPEINEEIKPEIGSFAIFSSFLKHGCEKNTDDHSKFGLSFNIKETTAY